jgi:nicotinamide mononucleotide (NMN) deamidase PncC
MYGDAAGHTCVALAGPGGAIVSRTLETGLCDREANMRLFAAEALDLLKGGLA